MAIAGFAGSQCSLNQPGVALGYASLHPRLYAGTGFAG
jgi:hypothetical protein